MGNQPLKHIKTIEKELEEKNGAYSQIERETFSELMIKIKQGTCLTSR
jgi:hypothetical protein